MNRLVCVRKPDVLRSDLYVSLARGLVFSGLTYGVLDLLGSDKPAVAAVGLSLLSGAAFTCLIDQTYREKRK